MYELIRSLQGGPTLSQSDVHGRLASAIAGSKMFDAWKRGPAKIDPEASIQSIVPVPSVPPPLRRRFLERLHNPEQVLGRPLFSNRTDFLMPSWFIKVLTGANFVYMCPSQHLWFTRGFESILYCVKSSVLWGSQSGERNIPSLEDICVSSSAPSGSLVEVKGVAGVVVDKNDNIFILEFGKSACVRRYRTGYWTGHGLVLQPQAHAVDPKTGDMTTDLILPGCAFYLERGNHLDMLTFDGLEYRIMIRRCARSSIIELEYDETRTGIYKITGILDADYPTDQFAHIVFYREGGRIYVYIPSCDILRIFDKEWNYVSSLSVPDPTYPVIASEIDPDTGYLLLYVDSSGIPLVCIEGYDEMPSATTLRDTLVATIEGEGSTVRAVRLERGSDGILVYCKDRIIRLSFP